jgi:hypothetical protein
MADELSRQRLSPVELADIAAMSVGDFENLTPEGRLRLFSALVITCTDLMDACIRADVLISEALRAHG